MGIEIYTNLAYIVAAALFIFGLKMLGSPATARRGNAFSSMAMLIAVVAGLIGSQAVSYEVIIVGMLIGALIGTLSARLVAMTSMPELVALFNGSGGASSLLVGWATLYYFEGDSVPTFTAATIVLAILIGGLTFTGSLIAYGKLSERINSAALVFSGQRVLNSALLLAIVACAYLFCMDPSATSVYLYALLGLALLLGVMAVIPIGGADMPVVISLLNSYSGIAACAAGFAVGNNILIVAGALVGASGIILTNIMCKARRIR
jgi:H+-translocating NAD(P) transhydrogenase subunit beta